MELVDSIFLHGLAGVLCAAAFVFVLLDSL